MNNFILGAVFGCSVLTLCLFTDGSLEKVRLGRQAQEVIAQCEKDIPRYMNCKISAEIREAK